MSRRPTPETDAAVIPLNGDYVVWHGFARRMECDRDEAREERDKLKQLLKADSENVDAYLGVCTALAEAESMADGLAEQAERLRKERDEARADAINLRRMSVVEMMGENLNVNHHVKEWENRCLKVERKRDEAHKA